MKNLKSIMFNYVLVIPFFEDQATNNQFVRKSIVMCFVA